MSHVSQLSGTRKVKEHDLVAPDQAKKVKMWSDHSTSGFHGAENGKLSFKTFHIYLYLSYFKSINLFLILLRNVLFMVLDVRFSLPQQTSEKFQKIRLKKQSFIS